MKKFQLSLYIIIVGMTMMLFTSCSKTGVVPSKGDPPVITPPPPSQTMVDFTASGWKQDTIRVCKTSSIDANGVSHDWVPGPPKFSYADKYFTNGSIQRTDNGNTGTVNAKWKFGNNETQVILTVPETDGPKDYVKYIQSLTGTELVWRYTVIEQGTGTSWTWEERDVH